MEFWSCGVVELYMGVDMWSYEVIELWCCGVVVLCSYGDVE